MKKAMRQEYKMLKKSDSLIYCNKINLTKFLIYRTE